MPVAAQPTLSAIRIYPVKSCHCVQLDECEIGALGPKHDRRFMFIEESNKRFITQRKYSSMALIRPLVDVENDTLTLTGPGQPDLTLPLTPPKEENNRLTVTVWKDTITAYDMGDAAAAWIGKFFKDHRQHNQMNPHSDDGGMGGVGPDVPPARLVAIDEQDYSRPSHDRLPGIHTAFSDSSPISFGCESSLEDVNGNLIQSGLSKGQSIPIDRFRNNLTISGTVAWDEDEWLVVQIGEVTFYVMRPTARCTVPGFNQDTGIKDDWGKSGVLDYLKVKRNLTTNPKQGYFCVDAAPLTKGTIRVGDPVKILERIPADKVERPVGPPPSSSSSNDN